MNLLAQQAFDRAFNHVAPARKPAEKPILAIAGKPERPKHFDQVGFLEGRRYATDTVMSMTATLRMPNGTAQILKLLKSAATGRPASQALGIWAVIELIEANHE